MLWRQVLFFSRTNLATFARRLRLLQQIPYVALTKHSGGTAEYD